MGEDGMRRAAVIGGGIAGLAAARVLAERGFTVTVLERDADPAAPSPGDAFAAWERPGAPQVRHSHAFLGRLRNLLRDRYPDLLEALLAAGARELRLMDRPPLTLGGMKAEPGDEDCVALGCRRTTFELVIRRAVLAIGRVAILPGAAATGLQATPGSPPAVTGVCVRNGSGDRTLCADLVVDASGKDSKAASWLAAIGAGKPEEDLRSSGIVYYTRFYRLRDGAAEPPQTVHPAAADFDWIKYAVFPADDRTFSITLAVPLAVQRLKVLARVEAFATAVQCIPGLSPWVDPRVAEPLDLPGRPVQAMGGLINRRRRFVVDGRPLALGFFALGDAAYCTNPLYGRGCAQAFLHADLLGRALDRHPDDLGRAACELDRLARAAIEPFYRASVLADLDAVRKAEGRAPRGLSNRLRARFFEDGVTIATRTDPVVFRAFMRMFNMLDTPAEAFFRPGIVLRTLRVLARGRRHNRRYAIPDVPDRDVTIARCEGAVAR